MSSPEYATAYQHYTGQGAPPDEAARLAAEWVLQRPKEPPKPTSNRKVLLIVAAVVLGGAAFLGSAYGIASPTRDPARGAERACEQFIEARLKAPSTARFPRETVSKNTVGAYVVEGQVDAQNGFGAMIRMDYTCTVSPGDDGWELHNLTGLE